MRPSRRVALATFLLSIAVSGCSGSFSNHKQVSASDRDSAQIDADARDFQIAVEKSSLATLATSENLEETHWKALGHFENAIVSKHGVKPEFLNPKSSHTFLVNFGSIKNLNECSEEFCTRLYIKGISAELQTACVIQNLAFAVRIEGHLTWPSDTIFEYEVFEAQFLNRILAGCSSEGDAHANALLSELENTESPAYFYIYEKQFLYVNVGQKTWVFTVAASTPAK